MAKYQMPKLVEPPKTGKKQVLLVASGDQRLSANRKCWPAQKAMEDALAEAVAAAGCELVRAHPYKEDEQHGFIGSQKEGMCIFAGIDPKARLIVAEAVWQYSHHVLAGLLVAQGADPDRGQLVGHLAGAGRHAEPERLADEGGQEVFDALERGFHRRGLPRTSAAGWTRGK